MLPECTRHPEGLALLQKCKETPHDQVPRLILADWLEDQGEEEMAKQIQSSIKWGGRDGFGFSRDLHDRWAPINCCHDGWLCVYLPSDQETPPTDFFSSPWVCGVELSLQENAIESISSLRDWAKNLSLAKLRIDIRDNCLHLTQAIRSLAGAHEFAGVVDFRLLGNLLGNEQVVAFFTDFLPRQLDVLQLSGNFGERAAIRALARSESVSSLTNLVLLTPMRSPAAVKELASAPRIRHLRELLLAQTQMGDAGARMLAGSPILEKLTRLIFFENQIGDSGVEALFGHGSPRMLNELFLGHNNITSAGAKFLANSAAMTSVRDLDIRNNSLGDAGCTSMARSSRLGQLQTLYLYSNGIGPVGAAALAGSTCLKELTGLGLGQNPIGDGVGAFADSRHLHQLVVPVHNLLLRSLH